MLSHKTSPSQPLTWSNQPPPRPNLQPMITKLTLPTFSQVTFSQMTLCQMMFCQMTFCQMTFCLMTFCQMTFCQMTFSHVTFCQMTLCQMTCGTDIWRCISVTIFFYYTKNSLLPVSSTIRCLDNDFPNWKNIKMRSSYPWVICVNFLKLMWTSLQVSYHYCHLEILTDKDKLGTKWYHWLVGACF